MVSFRIVLLVIILLYTKDHSSKLAVRGTIIYRERKKEEGKDTKEKREKKTILCIKDSRERSRNSWQ